MARPLNLDHDHDDHDDHPPLTFLALPRELRDQIYTHVFTNNTVQLSHNHRPWNIGLLRACRQTRAEALRTFYHATTFYTGVHVASLDRWLRRPRPQEHVRWVQEVRRVDVESKWKDNGGRVAAVRGLVAGVRREGVSLGEGVVKVALRGPGGEEVWAADVPVGWPEDLRARMLDRRDVWVTGR
jgi:hypothetical protein